MAVSKSTETPDEIRRRIAWELSCHLELDGVDVRVYTYLTSFLNYETPVHVPQIQMATEMGRQKTHISRSIKALVQEGLIIPGPEGPRSSKWRLNPDYRRAKKHGGGSRVDPRLGVPKQRRDLSL